MTEDHPNLETPPDPPSSAARRRWRDDPLSAFLAVAAVLLAGMYLLEQRDIGVIEDAGARAQALGAGELDIEGCTVGSASTDGQTLVVACSSAALDAATVAATRTPDLAGFDKVIFVGTDLQLSCPPQPSAWPNGCVSGQLPSTPTS